MVVQEVLGTRRMGRKLRCLRLCAKLASEGRPPACLLVGAWQVVVVNHSHQQSANRAGRVSGQEHCVRLHPVPLVVDSAVDCLDHEIGPMLMADKSSRLDLEPASCRTDVSLGDTAFRFDTKLARWRWRL
jgi:hypothetical protein